MAIPVAVLCGVVLCGAMHAACAHLFQRSRWFAPDSSAAERSIVAQSGVNAIISLAIFCFYVSALLDSTDWRASMFGDAEAAVRAFGTSGCMVAGLVLNLALVVYETVLYFYHVRAPPQTEPRRRQLLTRVVCASARPR